jgi:hypothetical protein
MKIPAICALLLLSGTFALAQNEIPISEQGITVAPPKVYDTYYLQQQLQALKAQLQQLQVLSSSTLTGHIGNVQGADLQQLGFSLQGGGSSTPAVTTTTGTSPSVQSVVSSLAPSNPSVASSSLTLPTPGQSSLDTLNESMQLAYEITNLELVLDGALNDKLDLMTGKPRRVVTIGFPIAFAPPSHSDAMGRANSVAEVHVTLCRQASDVSIMTVLPQERTYNVAGLVDHSAAASLGAILGGVFSVGGGFLWHHQRYDLVQQQETVALRTPFGDCGNGQTASSSSFVWQVYPVLGSKYVRPGMQQNFVQFSIPGGTIAPVPGSEIVTACVQAGWRGTAKNGNILSPLRLIGSACYRVPYFDTTPRVESVRVANIGSSQLRVTARGSFLPGTTVRIGNSSISDAAVSISGDGGVLEFPVVAADLITAGGAKLVSREGEEKQLSNPGGKEGAVPLNVADADIAVSPYSEALDSLTLAYTPPTGPGLPLEPCSPMPGAPDEGKCIPSDPWVLTIGDKTYGLADAPFFGDRALGNGKREISVLVPAASLATSSRITLQRLLWSNHFYYWQGLLPANPVTVTKATIVSSAPGVHLVLVGSNLGDAVLKYPGACPGCLHDARGSFALLDIPAEAPRAKETTKQKAAREKAATDATKDLKQIILCRQKAGGCDPGLAPVIFDLPKATDDAAAKSSKPSLKSGATVKVNAATASIAGTGLDQVVSIRYGTVGVPSRLSIADPPQLVLDLPTAISGRASKYPLLVEFADKTTTSYVLTVQ